MFADAQSTRRIMSCDESPFEEPTKNTFDVGESKENVLLTSCLQRFQSVNGAKEEVPKTGNHF